MCLPAFRDCWPLAHRSHLPRPPHLACSVSLPRALGYLWSPSPLSPQHDDLVFDLSVPTQDCRVLGHTVDLTGGSCLLPTPVWRAVSRQRWTTASFRHILTDVSRLSASCASQRDGCGTPSYDGFNRHLWDSEGSCPSLHHIAAVQQSPSIRFTHLTHIWSSSCWALTIPCIFQVSISCWFL